MFCTIPAMQYFVRGRFLKFLYYIIDPVSNLIVGVYEGGADTSIYKCWNTNNPSQIILTSSEKLSADKIYFPIRYIAPQSYELSVLYYIHLKQYALSHDAYLFYQKMKKNTEQLGTVFDAQPSDISGNIHCINNPDEVVIGYVEVSQEQEKKLFISHSQLPINWIPQIPCSEVIIANIPGQLTADYIPTHVATTGMMGIATFYAAEPVCVDCTLRGTNVRPSFWP